MCLAQFQLVNYIQIRHERTERHFALVLFLTNLKPRHANASKLQFMIVEKEHLRRQIDCLYFEIGALLNIVRST